MTIRDAIASDNAALLKLTAACPMVGDSTICIERDPDFFALNRLAGERWRVGVVDVPGHPVAGCAAIAVRQVNLCGRVETIAYGADFKVHPEHRGTRVAFALLRWGHEVCREYGGENIPFLATVLAGNRVMERLTKGRRGFPDWTRFATIRAHAIPLIVPRRAQDAALRISPATVGDVEAMMELWRSVAPHRHFTPVLDAEIFKNWVAAAPGLALDDYWLAWRRDGRLAGFAGVWVQEPIKRLRVLAYSKRLGAARILLNAIGRVTRSAPLPPPGSVLRTATVLHPCIADDEPAVLHALLLRIHQALRRRGFAFFTVGLDVRDPLSAALRGLWAQPTDINAYVATPAGRWAGPAPTDRALYYDVALV